MIFREPSILFHRDFTLKKYNSCITAAGAGRVSATAADDGLVANDGVLISGGALAVTSGGGSANTAVKTGNAMFGGWDAGTAEEETTSMKGVKAQTALEITGGTLTLDTADDSLHSNGTAAVSGGTIDVTASDDGFNAAGGTDDSAENGMFGPDAFASDVTKSLTFEGGAGNLGGMREPGGMQAPDTMQQPAEERSEASVCPNREPQPVAKNEFFVTISGGL